MFQLTRFSHNTVFFRNQNARYAGTRCTRKNSNIHPHQSQFTLSTLLWDTLYICYKLIFFSKRLWSMCKNGMISNTYFLKVLVTIILARKFSCQITMWNSMINSISQVFFFCFFLVHISTLGKNLLPCSIFIGLKWFWTSPIFFGLLHIVLD